MTTPDEMAIGAPAEVPSAGSAAAELVVEGVAGTVVTGIFEETTTTCVDDETAAGTDELATVAGCETETLTLPDTM